MKMNFMKMMLVDKNWFRIRRWQSMSGVFLAGFLLLFCIFGLNGSPVAGISVSAPNGGESWEVGSHKMITWETDGITGNISIRYSIDGGINWQILVEETENDGRFEWTIPNTVSAQCLVKIAASGPNGCETRGTWLWASSFLTPEDRKVTFQTLEKAKINTVMVSIPRVNGNWGYGNHESFLEFIKEAKERELSVHAWFINSRRTWLTEVTEIDYRKPDEQAAQSQWVQDIMTDYGQYLDGIHLDYIRYLDFEEVNVDGKMDGVRETVRRIRHDLNENFPGKYLSAAVFSLKANRFDRKDEGRIWREQVPVWFQEWCDSNPDSYYTSNNYYYMGPHHMQVQQDPVGWMNEGIMDAVMPMQYSLMDEVWQRDTDYWKRFNEFTGNDFTRVYSGLAWKENKYDPPGVVRKIKYDRLQGYKGNMIFILRNHDVDDTPLIEALTVDSEINDFNAPYKNRVPSCLTCAECASVADVSDSDFSIIPAGGAVPVNYDIGDFSVFGTNSVYLRTGCKVSNGDIGVIDRSNQAKLGIDSEVLLANSVYLSNDVSVFGDRVKIKSGSSVGNVFCNTLKNFGTVRGSVQKPLGLPMNVSMPVFFTSVPGTEAVIVGEGETRLLPAGAYGKIRLKKSATLIFLGGTYYIENVEAGDYSNVYFRGATKLVINNRFSTGINPEIGPEKGSGITARHIVMYVNGKNGSSGGLSEEPKTVTIGIRQKLNANIYAPNGTIHLKARGRSEGAFIGRDVLIDFYVEVVANSSF